MSAMRVLRFASSASVCLGGAGRQCIEAVLPLATDEVRVDCVTHLDAKATIGQVSEGLPHAVPMLATLVAEPFDRDGWIYEEKVDGWRIVAVKDGSRVGRACRGALSRIPIRPRSSCRGNSLVSLSSRKSETLQGRND